MLAAIDEAAGKGAELVVFPETFVPYYPYFSFVLPPVLTGREHLRLYEKAVVGARPGDGRGGRRAPGAHGIVVVLGVNERDHGSLYNTQLVFDADGTLVLKRRKITPTYHERMIWGQGDGAGLTVVDTRGRPRRRAGLLGALQPAGPLRPDGAARGDPRRAVPRLAGRADLRRPDRGTIRHHALESGCSFEPDRHLDLVGEDLADQRAGKLRARGSLRAAPSARSGRAGCSAPSRRARRRGRRACRRPQPGAVALAPDHALVDRSA